jgi:protein-S-isoprenylcysteine O-methyltransferase Ste14
MSDAHVSHHLKRNPLFLGAIALMVFAPSLITFYMPSLIVGLPDAVWLGGGWLVGVLAVLVGDEALHHEEKKVLGDARMHALFLRLIRNPLFLLSAAVIIIAPPAIAFFMPQAVPGSPDWLWLIIALVVAAAAAFGGYIALTSEEEHVVHPATA